MQMGISSYLLYGLKGYITGKGRIRVGNLDFDSVSFVKELGHFNLFSISQICDKQHKVLFTESECLVVSPDFKMPDENQILLKVPRQHNMYSFDMKTPSLTKDYACLIAKATCDESKLWHRRLGHINFKNLNKLVKGNLVRGLPSKVFKNDHTCVACQKGKQHRASCKAKLERMITEPLHTLHMDLFGPTFVKSINHASYYLVITDDCTRFSWVFFLATKDETSGILQNFIRQIENQLNHRVKIIRSDNGTEFKNRDMLEFCGDKGIKQEYSNARTPQQNGVAKRMNRTLIEAARTIEKLVKRVKKLETRVKYGNLPTRKMVLCDSETKDAANSSKQGRNLGEEGVFETPKGKDSGETNISPSGLQAAETLVQVASQKTKTYTRRVKSGLKKKLDVGVSYDDRKFKSTSEEIKSRFTNISSGEVREEEAILAEIARIQAQEAAEIERKTELQRLDALAAKRLNDEFEMSKQQRKRAAEGYAKKMVELVEKRRREIREQKLKAKKNKPMTQAEQRNYIMNYVISQSHGWIIPQLKKLSFEELKKESLKRSGETLQGAEKKKQKVLDVEDIHIPESAKFMKEEEIEVKQPIVKWKILRHGDDLDERFAENLRIMFDPPQSEDTVWSLPMHIPIVNWRYYESCNVHCLNLHNTTAIYMLAERSYPLSEEVCTMMLKKKLFAQNTEVKKKLVKSIEKKVGIKA
ncbi:putative ribonuclease H-like domain-containing protein [Tanacetum coccineum]